jgi:Fe-S oxidoreductase
LKRRFFHKLSYQYIQQNKRHGCVGCGRCITTCLADINMPLVVKAIRKQNDIVVAQGTNV